MYLFDYNYCTIIMSLTMLLVLEHSKSDSQSQHVVNLTVNSNGPTALDVKWTPLQRVNDCARYLLTYSTRFTHEVKLTDGNNLTLTELNECTAYTISVMCAYGSGENVQFGPSTSSVTLTSHTSRLLAAKNLTVETSSDSALIAWENCAVQQPCVAYSLVLLRLAGADVIAGRELRTESSHYLVTALEPCATYSGHVATVDLAGAKGTSVPFNFTTDIAIPGPVSKLSAFSNDSQSIFVSWDKPTNAIRCVHRYEVNYCYDVFVCSTISTQVNSLTITQLKPCVTYQITVTPKLEDNVNGLSAKTEATVISEALNKPNNGRVLISTNYTATLQWDPPTNFACDSVDQIVNCSYLNTSFEVTSNNQNRIVVLENLKPFTKYTCYSIFFNKEGNSPKSHELVFWTKLTVPDPPTNLSALKLNSYRVILTWAPPTTIFPATIDGYLWKVTFKHYLYTVPKYCRPQTDNHTVTFFIKNYQTYEYEITNLRPASSYFIELSASNESGFGNSTNITIHTSSSISSPVEDLKVVSVKSNLVVLSWKYPCVPNGKIAFFHSTLVGERVGHHNHIFSTSHDISENETEFVYTLTYVLPEYSYLCTVVAVTQNVDIPGQDNRTQFNTPSTNPNLPAKYDTYRRLRVTKLHLTNVRVSIPDDLFSNVNGNIQYYSIIVYQDGGFPDKPEHNNENLYEVWPPVMRTWAEAAPYPFILAYQTTPDRWMPFKNQKDAVFYDIGADESCRINDEKKYCNGPLRPVTNYRLKLRAFTANGFQDSWTVPFTTPGESMAVYYLVLCSVLFALLITVSGMYCMLNKKVPWTVKYSLIPTTAMESGLPGDMNVKQLLAKSPQEIEAEFNLLNIYLKSNPSTDVAMSPQNKFKNRYVNTLPYDHNRVIIKSSDSDYINASFIEDSKGARQYIACQGPMRNTCIDMWQMILDQNVASIVMLCQTTENDKVKCEKYYPNSKEKLIFGDIQVKNDIMIVDEKHSFTTRILTVLKGNLKKTIRHFQFHDWPDFGTPDNPSELLQFCLMVQAKSPMGLFVVHCSAGVGRTGTYIACDMLLRQVLQDSTKFNIFKMVLNLREQRTNMVQTQAQYEFIYGLLRFYIKKYLLTKSFDSEKTIDNDSASITEMDEMNTTFVKQTCI